MSRMPVSHLIQMKDRKINAFWTHLFNRENIFLSLIITEKWLPHLELYLYWERVLQWWRKERINELPGE